MKLSFHEIGPVVSARNNIKIFPDFQVRNIEFDSRKIKKGDIFLPLKGLRDGHNFIERAFLNGCQATFTEHKLQGTRPYILVDDCLTAFQDLSQYYLNRMKVDVIAITGSNGKTTTKNMLAQLLGAIYQTYQTQGNYNNEIGLPYTVLHMPDRTERLVLEMGQDHLGDIHFLSMLAQPKSGIVTVVGEAHLEFLGSRREIARGKMQLADGMKNGALLLVPVDSIVDDFLPPGKKIIRFGDSGDIFITRLSERPGSLTFETNFTDTSFTLPVTGKYNAVNAMLAAYIAILEGVSQEAIADSFQKFKLPHNRTEWKTAWNGAEILSDVYNSNPTATRLVLETFGYFPKKPGGRKVVVLADMKELGIYSSQLHADIVKSLDPRQIDILYLFGPEMRFLHSEVIKIYPLGSYHYFENMEEMDKMIYAIKSNLKSEDQILLKGSNCMNLEEVVEALEIGHSK